MSIVLLCTCLVLIRVYATVPDGLRQDLQGCYGGLLQEVKDIDSLLQSNNAVAYLETPLSIHELQDYRQEADMYTAVHPALVIGKRNNTPHTSRWVNSMNTWAVPRSHARNSQRERCFNETRSSSQSPQKLYTVDKQSMLITSFYLLKMQNAVIHMNGYVGVHCGYFHPLEACVTSVFKGGSSWYLACLHNLKIHRMSWLDQFKHHNSTTWPKKQSHRHGNRRCRIKNIPSYEHVFMTMATWDFNYHHFLLESLSRLIHYYEFLLEHPHIKIHIRATLNISDPLEGHGVPLRFFSLLGINESRLIQGNARAVVVYIPRPIACSSPLSHPLEVRALSKLLLYKSFPELFQNFSYKQVKSSTLPQIHTQLQQWRTRKLPTVLLQRRPGDGEWRVWNDGEMEAMVNATRGVFVEHTLNSTSAGDPIIHCLSCQIEMYSNTDVLIGLHGAGLTNVMFMRPGSVVIEIFGGFDGRALPLCGHYGPFAAAFGIHHYVYYYDWEGGERIDFSRAQEIASEGYKFVQEVNSRRSTIE